MTDDIKIHVYGIRITQGGRAIESELIDDSIPDDAPINAAMHAIESMVLAHHNAGVDIASPAYLEGLETAIDACENRFDGTQTVVWTVCGPRSALVSEEIARDIKRVVEYDWSNEANSFSEYLCDGGCDARDYLEPGAFTDEEIDNGVLGGNPDNEVLASMARKYNRDDHIFPVLVRIHDQLKVSFPVLMAEPDATGENKPNHSAETGVSLNLGC